jgi:hypothetical protein
MRAKLLFSPNEADANKAYPYVNGSSVSGTARTLLFHLMRSSDHKCTGLARFVLLPSGVEVRVLILWCRSGLYWFSGINNIYPKAQTTVSSFEAIDQVVQWFANQTNFPNLKQIVVAGHSAGAQMTHRYAVAGTPLNLKGPHPRQRFNICDSSDFTHSSRHLLDRKSELLRMVELLSTHCTGQLHNVQQLVRRTSQLGNRKL